MKQDSDKIIELKKYCFYFYDGRVAYCRQKKTLACMFLSTWGTMKLGRGMLIEALAIVLWGILWVFVISGQVFF